MESERKRAKILESKLEVATATSEAGKAAIAAVKQQRRLESVAKARADTPWRDSADVFDSRNKHTAINSDFGGEMIGVQGCFRLLCELSLRCC